MMSVLTSIIVRLSRQRFIVHNNLLAWLCRSYYPYSGLCDQWDEFYSSLSEQVNVHSNNYWSATEYAPNTNNAWNFNMNNGNQNNNNKNNSFYGWAVQSG